MSVAAGRWHFMREQQRVRRAMRVERRVCMPERVALVVQAPALINEYLAAGIEVACIEELGLREPGHLLAEQLWCELEPAELAAELNMSRVVEARAAEDADRKAVHPFHDLAQG